MSQKKKPSDVGLRVEILIINSAGVAQWPVFSACQRLGKGEMVASQQIEMAMSQRGEARWLVSPSSPLSLCQRNPPLGASVAGPVSSGNSGPVTLELPENTLSLAYGSCSHLPVRRVT